MCKTILYKYKKGGSGSLIKIRPAYVLENFTKGLNI